MTGQLRLSTVYACAFGNQPSVMEKTYSSSRAIQKYGNDDRNSINGGSVLSKTDPRRHAEMMPSPVPNVKAMMVENPSRKRVHGRSCRMIVRTDAGK